MLCVLLNPDISDNVHTQTIKKTNKIERTKYTYFSNLVKLSSIFLNHDYVSTYFACLFHIIY